MPISRRSFVSAALPLFAQQQPPRERPNIVFVMTDDQGYGDIGRHGNPVLRTPNLDALHDQSLRLTNYHVSPTCAPTRSALLTGRYTNLVGPWHTIQGRSILHQGEVTIADNFRAGGYRTGIFGKWHLGDNYPARPQDRGFDETVIHGGGGIWQTPDHFGNDYFDDTYLHNGKPQKYSGFCTDVFFENARNFIDDAARRKQPFFCYLPTNAPHGPMWAPDRNTTPYANVKGLREPGFYGMIENIDENVGQLRKHLAATGLARNTIFIFTTDNGTASGAQVHNAGMRGSKGSPYEGGHRVPFFMHWPQGGMTTNRPIDTLTAHIDVMPTLLDLTGVKRVKGPEIHGRSLKPLLQNQQWPARTIVTDSQREETLLKWRQASVMTQEWRLVSPGPGGAAEPAKLELYDIRTDPSQKVDVAAKHPEVVARLKADYEKWWTLVSARASEYARIVLGDPKDNPARLTSHDWHGEGALRSWNQKAILEGPDANGFWAVQTKPGRYTFELRRWPREINLPLGAAYTHPAGNRETTPGRAIPGIHKARIRIGALDRTIDIDPAASAAKFELDLPGGPADLQTWLLSSDGSERGAYFVYAERTGN
jgi:arylsulfatase A-like enzyme